MITRRNLRFAVVGLFWISFAGPWGPEQGFVGLFLEEFELGEASVWTIIWFACFLAVPSACLAANLSSSRTLVLTYRVGAVIAVILASAFLALMFALYEGPTLEDTMMAWGIALYFVLLYVALAVEFFPDRPAPPMTPDPRIFQ